MGKTRPPAAVHPVFDLDPRTRELEGLAFGCLPGCGWCCTHPAEVNRAEERRIRELRPNVRVGVDGERTYLRLQGGCGACQFLTADRACGVYEDRPGHCRWFPFHVYFGRVVEVVLNRSCPGVAEDADGDLRPAARETLATAEPEVVARNVRESAEAHAAFRRLCEEAGAWGDVDAAVEAVVAQGAEVFTRDALEGLAGMGVRDVVENAAHAFEGGDPTLRPYYADPDLRWLVFQRRAARVAAAELAPSGSLQIRQVLALDAWEDPAPELRQALAPHLASLLRRESFAGSVFDRVDEAEYGITVEEAAAEEAAGVAVDLVLRARLVAQLRPQPDPARWAAEARRFYDSDFLDRPTIGAWL